MHTDSDRLTAQELYVIHKSFGVGSPDFDESSELCGAERPSREELPEIEARALRKLRRMTLDSFRVLREAV